MARVAVSNGLTVLAVVCLLNVPASAGQARTGTPPERSGREVYESTCIACHGPDGRGKANPELAKIIALPDFSDCQFAEREPDVDWLAVAHRGGPARGFSPLMRPWAGDFSGRELELAVSHLRTFCADKRWPRGELNLPRPLVTGKAYPEDEIVVTTATTRGDEPRVVSKFVYERRIGPLNQVEIAVPFASAEGQSGGWASGMGDIALGYKRTLSHSLTRGHIFSVSGEVVLPTGSERRGLGSGVTVFEPFVTFGKLLPANAFVQAQGGFELPASGDRDNEAFWRAAVGRSFRQGGFGRTWSPMLELVAARPLASGRPTDWDLIPQMQVTLSARQHVMISGGLRVPVTDRAHRSTSVITYLLWDWFDGGFLAGW